ncbi:MAG TPA: PmoA family protein [Candidatus Dormibacteraeota bacterium]|nr:PmoA family protein [Candidatus Dormibacteraeota bacterium]
MRTLPWLACFLATPAVTQEKFSVIVEAGAYDRHEVVVAFKLPPEVRSARTLRRGQETIPLQVAKDGTGMFKVTDLGRGKSISYDFVVRDDQAPARGSQLRSRQQDSRIQFAFTSTAQAQATPQPLLEYQAEAGPLPRADIKPIFKRGGYLHPIRTLSGRLVTDDYAPNHLHHHGVWWAWTKTKFDGREPDFWNMGEAKGRVEYLGMDSTWEGPVHAGLRAQHRFVDLTAAEPVVALSETWTVTVFGPAGRTAWIFELESEQTCNTGQPLSLPEYHYGGLGVRGNRAWDGKDHTYFLTSEGETDRIKAHATRARWCDMSGEVDGQRVGIAILGHPLNFRSPQPMRVHPTEPFFCFAPQQAGDMLLRPGEIYRSRYRFVVHDGPPDRTDLDRLWNDFASPPVARVARTDVRQK